MNQVARHFFHPIIMKTLSTTLTVTLALAVWLSAMSPQVIQAQSTGMQPTATGIQSLELVGTAIYYNERLLPFTTSTGFPLFNNRTLVAPLQPFFSGIGVHVRLDSKTNTITATRNQQTLQLRLGSRIATINGKLQKTLNVAPTSINRRIMVPVADTARLLGYTIRSSPVISNAPWLQSMSKDKRYNPNNLPVYYVREINLDRQNQNEVVVAFARRDVQNPEYTVLNRIWLGRVINNQFQLLADLAQQTAISFDIEIIRLQGSTQPYIYTRATDGNDTGFSLFRWGNERLTAVVKNQATGISVLVDRDVDGYLDGFTSTIQNFNSCGYKLQTFHEWRSPANRFESKETRLLDFQTPNQAVSIVREYVQLTELNAGIRSTDVRDQLLRLSATVLTPPKRVLEMNVCAMGTLSDFRADILEQTATQIRILATATNARNERIGALFTLTKSQNRWRILSIE